MLQGLEVPGTHTIQDCRWLLWYQGSMGIPVGAHPWGELMTVCAGVRSHPRPALAPALLEAFGPKVFTPWELVVLRVGKDQP